MCKANKNTLLRLLVTCIPYVEHEDNEGYMLCSLCSSSGWGWVEHKPGCTLVEARVVLGLCPHGFAAGYDHGNGACR